MNRKIWKVLISLLFLAVAAAAAVFSIKIFSHNKSVSNSVQTEEDITPDTLRPQESGRITTKYGIAPVGRPSRYTTRYGVISVGRVSRK